MHKDANVLWLGTLLLGLAACTKKLGPEEHHSEASYDVFTGAIGRPCEASDERTCGTEGRVAIAEVRSNGVERPLPCRAATLPGGAGHGPSQACVLKERVYLQSTCMACRTYASWELTGLVAEMTDRQLLEAQEAVGFPQQPLLRTPAMWRAAIASVAVEAH
jgi:hypothetical protein